MRRGARETGAVAIQNRGTVGGNIANASPGGGPAAGAARLRRRLEVASSRGPSAVAYDGRFHTGYKHMDLAPDELIVSVNVPSAAASGVGGRRYRKVGTRRAQAISKICFAAAAAISRTASFVTSACLRQRRPNGDSRPRRRSGPARPHARSAKTLEAARAALARDISPIDDIRSTAAYRLTVAGNLLEGFLS